jgi:phosphonate transport system permease protein
MIGAGGIGVVLYDVIRSFEYAQTCAVMLIVILVVSALDVVSAKVRAHLI